MTKPLSNSDRRRFARLELSDDAIAVDKSGRELGKVTQASGGVSSPRFATVSFSVRTCSARLATCFCSSAT